MSRGRAIYPVPGRRGRVTGRAEERSPVHGCELIDRRDGALPDHLAVAELDDPVAGRRPGQLSKSGGCGDHGGGDGCVVLEAENPCRVENAASDHGRRRGGADDRRDSVGEAVVVHSAVVRVERR